MLSPRSILAKLMFLAVALSWAAQAWPFEGYYSGGIGTTTACTACHSPTVNTCAGCHAHGTHADATKISINLVASTDKATYAPGENVTVTVTGGYRGGWVRVNLYDQDMAPLASSSCPGGAGGCTTSVLPATLTTTAPTAPGTYTWRAAWYGTPMRPLPASRRRPVAPPSRRRASGRIRATRPRAPCTARRLWRCPSSPSQRWPPVRQSWWLDDHARLRRRRRRSVGLQTFTISNTGNAALTGRWLWPPGRAPSSPPHRRRSTSPPAASP